MSGPLAPSNDPRSETRALELDDRGASDRSLLDQATRAQTMITKAPSNANAPRVTLRATGDGALLYRTLARVLVRRLIAEATNPVIADRETWPAAG